MVTIGEHVEINFFQDFISEGIVNGNAKSIDELWLPKACRLVFIFQISTFEKDYAAENNFDHLVGWFSFLLPRINLSKGSEWMSACSG